MPAIRIKDIRQYVEQETKEALTEEILSLVKKFPAVKEYYHLKLLPAERTHILAKYKKIIQHEFFPLRGVERLRLSTIRNAINDYKKISSDPEGRIELLLFFVDQGAEFIQAYGDIKESFYDSMESAYQEACQLVLSIRGEQAWKDRFHAVARSTNGSGYGFYDNISDIFEETFRTNRDQALS